MRDQPGGHGHARGEQTDRGTEEEAARSIGSILPSLSRSLPLPSPMHIELTHKARLTPRGPRSLRGGP